MRKKFRLWWAWLKHPIQTYRARYYYWYYNAGHWDGGTYVAPDGRRIDPYRSGR